MRRTRTTLNNNTKRGPVIAEDILKFKNSINVGDEIEFFVSELDLEEKDRYFAYMDRKVKVSGIVIGKWKHIFKMSNGKCYRYTWVLI